MFGDENKNGAENENGNYNNYGNYGGQGGYENNSGWQNGNNGASGNNNYGQNGNNGERPYSDIRYTYSPGGNSGNKNYNTTMGNGQPPKKKNGTGFFVAIIAVLLCITVAAAGISLYSLFGKGSGTASESNGSTGSNEAVASSGTTSDGSSSDIANTAFDNVVTVQATPTPTVVEGEKLTLQQVAEKLLPSVVCIQCYTTTNSYFGSTNTSSLYGEGSGIISRADGYIITNAHVIDEATSVQVVLNSGTTCDAEVIGSDTVTDIALLKINPDGLELTPATFTSVENCHIGDTVLAIGNPGGIDFFGSVTSGIISAVNRAMQDEDTGYVMHCIQTDTAINPGNSGGPLVDLYGNVIGITSSKIVASGYENMGFAITYDEAAPIVNDLLSYGHVKNRATINITLSLPTSVFRMVGWNSIPTGLCITQVSGDAETKAGLQTYDIISAIDDVTISSMTDYSSYLLKKKPGDTVTLTIYRATINGWSVQYSSTPITVTLTLSEAS